MIVRPFYCFTLLLSSIKHGWTESLQWKATLLGNRLLTVAWLLITDNIMKLYFTFDNKTKTDVVPHQKIILSRKTLK